MDSSNRGGVGKDSLHDWIESETRALDLVASWETLCDVYRTLEFNDQLSDSIRMEEYRWIISEMNKHLSRARKKLMSCEDMESAVEVLQGMFTSTDAKVTNRMDLTYHKLRQMWVKRMLGILETTIQPENLEEEHGRNDFWNE